jgi:hypothetical protein
MARQLTNDPLTFYGATPRPIPGLAPQIVQRQSQGRPYAALLYSDARGQAFWLVRPMAWSRKGVPSFFRLYHRNRGRRGWHSQHVGVWGTRQGLQEIYDYIAAHEVYEWGEEGRGGTGSPDSC